MSFKVLVGSYTSFITALSFVTAPASSVGDLTVIHQSYAGTNPSWIATNPKNTSVIYAAQENEVGQLLAFTLDPQTGALTQTGVVSTLGGGPAHFGVLNSGQEIVAANYDSGSVADIVLGLDPSQLPSQAQALLNLTGSGPAPQQTSPHPHQVVEYIENQELLVPDLGSDKVWRLTRSSNGAWELGGSIQQPAGSGPRHIVPLGDILYTLHEISNTLTEQTLPALATGLQSTTTATLSVIPPGADNKTLAAGELLLSPNNTMYPTPYLYATNRLDTNPEGDTIAIFSLSPLTLVKQVRTGLNNIRGAAIGGPNGQYLIAAGLTGGGVAVFERIAGGADLQVVARLPTVLNATSFVFF